jgi:hypothetical protein
MSLLVSDLRDWMLRLPAQGPYAALARAAAASL